MAKAATKPVSHEVPQKDFTGAVRAYRNDVKPAISKVGEYSQEVSTAYKHIKKNCHIQPGAAKLAFKLDGMEEAKRDDFLRCFNGLCKELNIVMPRDMVDIAEGKPAESIVPEAERPKPQLVAVGQKADPEDEDQEDADPDAHREAAE
ncbi:MAG: hypothetical protein JNM03_10645 [Sphingopyxis sp.]|uniref:hypothetical protein n=1 Tax=Sphingopyxis sp. TaxID=1908224 RepID=UPI001A56E6FB|nr:hypothetical protein [Sphingopyxis sp.]MBL9070436.1 hypothetical protein [Sphingopyxis sp.]